MTDPRLAVDGSISRCRPPRSSPREGIDAEVIDVRSLSPIDYETIGDIGQENRAGRHRRGRTEDRRRQRRDRRGDHGAIWRESPGAGRARGLRRCAGSVHAGPGKRLPAGPDRIIAAARKIVID